MTTLVPPVPASTGSPAASASAISRWRASQYSGIASGLMRTWTLR